MIHCYYIGFTARGPREPCIARRVRLLILESRRIYPYLFTFVIYNICISSLMNHAGDSDAAGASASALSEPPGMVSGEGSAASTGLGSNHESAAAGALKYSCL